MSHICYYRASSLLRLPLFLKCFVHFSWVLPMAGEGSSHMSYFKWFLFSLKESKQESFCWTLNSAQHPMCSFIRALLVIDLLQEAPENTLWSVSVLGLFMFTKTKWFLMLLCCSLLYCIAPTNSLHFIGVLQKLLFMGFFFLYIWYLPL